MNKLNTTRQPRTRYVNTYEGGRGLKVGAEEELAFLTFASNFHDKFYETGKATLKRMEALVNQSRPEFVQQLARVARQEFNMRATPAALTAFYTLKHGQPDNDKLITDAFFRGDEIGDYLAVVESASRKGKVIPSAVRFARRVLQEQLNERKALRYARSGRAWSLAKIIRLSHARMGATPAQEALFNFVLAWNGEGSLTKAWETLPSAQRKLLPTIKQAVEGGDADGSISWERTISAAGAEKDWTRVVDKMGYMALLRNLRNFLQDVPAKNTEFWNTVTRRLADEEEVLASKQFPFRFYSAYKAIKDMQHAKTHAVIDALSTALDYSARNLPEFPEKTLIVIDASGSMSSGLLSDKSEMSYREVGEVLGAALFTTTGADVVHFGTTAYKHNGLDVNSGVLNTLNEFATVNHSTVRGIYMGRGGRKMVGHSTELGSIQSVVNVNDYDAIIVFSDMQLADSASSTLGNYKGKLYTVNMAGYEAQLDLRSNDVVAVGGWSEAVLRLMSLITRNQLIKYILDY